MSTTSLAGPPGGSAPLPMGRLIFVPALITLAVTVLRLVGELQNWSPRFFSREAGGAGAIIGIVWLVPVFGVYFALKLARAGEGPSSLGAAIGLALAGLLVIPATVAISRALGLKMPVIVAVFGVMSLAGLTLAWRGWPALGRTLFAYALAARVPVAALMLIAILARWGTHYEKGPPSFPAMGAVATWFWIAFTVVVGCLFGGIAAAVALRGRRPATV